MNTGLKMVYSTVHSGPTIVWNAQYEKPKINSQLLYITIIIIIIVQYDSTITFGNTMTH